MAAYEHLMQEKTNLKCFTSLFCCQLLIINTFFIVDDPEVLRHFLKDEGPNIIRFLLGMWDAFLFYCKLKSATAKHANQTASVKAAILYVLYI